MREILRQQPENIYNFGAKYFAELANPVSRDSTSIASHLHSHSLVTNRAGLQAPEGGGRAFESMSDEELLVWLTEIFVAADTDNNGIFQQPS